MKFCTVIRGPKSKIEFVWYKNLITSAPNLPWFLRATAATAVVHLSHRNSVCPSVTRVDQSKAVQARVTKFSLLAAWKTLVSGTVKLFHKFEGGYPERGR